VRYARETGALPIRLECGIFCAPTSAPTESYYGVLCHALTHWAGGKDRLDRQLGKRFGDAAYAMEELVAELGAAFLCANLVLRANHDSVMRLT
jgi:antirestriction protein ArdC